MNFFEYTFFRAYLLFESDYFYPGFSKMEFRAAVFMAMLFCANLVSIMNILGYPILQIWDGNYVILSVAIIMILFMFFFSRKKKLKALSDKFQQIPKEKRFGKDLLSVAYSLFTILFLVLTLWLTE